MIAGLDNPLLSLHHIFLESLDVGGWNRMHALLMISPEFASKVISAYTAENAPGKGSQNDRLRKDKLDDIKLADANVPVSSKLNLKHRALPGFRTLQKPD